MALESYCAACTYLGEKGDYNGKYYCSKKGENHYAHDSKCNFFCEAYSRSSGSRQNMFDYSKGHSGTSGCYLTTIMCQILEYPDNNYYLNTLRRFRDNTMKKDDNLIPYLVAYDTLGPMIATKLEKDPNNKEIATSLFATYITKAVSAIEEEKTKEAINIYCAMTESLAEHYHITIYDITRDFANDFNINVDLIKMDKTRYESLGHARKLKYIPNK